MNKIKTKKRQHDGRDLLRELGTVMEIFQSGIEGTMDVITGSFDDTKRRSEEISSLFKDARSEAELIFTIFNSIASVFAGRDAAGIFETLLGFIPGGELLSSFIGSSPSPGGSMYSQQPGGNPAPVVIVNTQLERAGMYRVYREGKLISEMRPGA
jgi:hypothetical protein